MTKIPTQRLLKELRLRAGMLSFYRERGWRTIRKYTPAMDIKSFLQRYGSSIGVGVIAAFIVVTGLNTLQTSAANAVLVPNADGGSNWPGSTGSSNYTEVDEGATPETGTYITATQTNTNFVQQFGMSTTGSIDQATSITLWVYANTVASGSGPDTLTLNATINGSSLGAGSPVPPTQGSYSWIQQTWTGNWSQSDIDTLEVSITRTVQGGGSPNSRPDEIRVSTVYVDLEYSIAVDLEQSSYRWFDNANSMSGGNAEIGPASAPQDTPAPAAGAFRLRATLNADGAAVDADALNLKLQYAMVGSDGLCDTGFSGESYADVMPQGAMEPEWEEVIAGSKWNASDRHAATAYDGAIWMTGVGAGTRQNVWTSENGVDWTQVTSSAPWAARVGQQMATFDDKMWVIGGANPLDLDDKFNDAWYSEDGLNWTQATGNAGWGARYEHMVVVHDEKMWVVGGRQNSGNVNDVWYSEDGASWTQATANAGWSVRTEHSATVHDDKIWVSGGFDGADRSDVWYSEDGASWTQATSNAQWSNRGYHAMQEFSGRLWVMGGWAGGNPFTDVWYSEDGVNWTELEDTPWPGRRQFPTVTFANHLWILGGYDGSNAMADIWRLSGFDAPISFYDNDQIADKSPIAAEADDPDPGGDVIPQQYVESNNFTNPNTIPNGDSGLWDFSLIEEGSEPGTKYCFRVVQANGSQLTNYSVVPEISIPDASVEQSNYRWFENPDEIDVETPTSFAVAEGLEADRDYYETVIATSDGGYLAGGWSYNTFDDAISKAIATKYGADGRIEWRRAYGTGAAANAGIFWSIIETEEGYLFAGQSTPGGSNFNAALVKYDFDGNLLWGSQIGSNVADSFFDVTELQEGGYIAVGRTAGKGGTGSTDIIYARFDEDGELEWANYLDGDGANDQLDGVAQIANGDVIAVGETNSFTSTQRGGILMQIDPVDGSIVRANDYGGSELDLFRGITATADGGYAVVGSISSVNTSPTASLDTVINKYAANGTLEWSRHFGAENGAMMAFDIAEFDNGDFALTGFTDWYSNDNEDKSFTARLDSEGELIYISLFGQDNDGGIIDTRSVAPTLDNGFAVVGYTSAFSDSVWDALFLKFDEEGTIENCSELCRLVEPFDILDASLPSPSLNLTPVDAGWSSNALAHPSNSIPLERIGILGDGSFMSTLGGSSNERYAAVTQIADGSIIAVGQTVSFGPGGTSTGWITKYTTGGHPLWSRSFGTNGLDVFESVTPTASGGFAIAGHTRGYGTGFESGVIAVFESDGSLDWTQYVSGSGSERLESIQQTSDEGFIVTGRSSTWSSGFSDPFIAKYDSSGSIEWIESFGGNNNNYFQSVTELSGGGYAVAGLTTNFGTNPPNDDAWIARISSTGTTEWVRTVGETGGFDVYYEIIQHSSGDLIAVGRTSSSMSVTSTDSGFISRFDTDGNHQWSRALGGSAVEWFRGVTEGVNGEIIAVGLTNSYGAGVDDGWVAVYDIEGDLQRVNTFGSVDNERFSGVSPTNDGGFVAVGQTVSWESGVTDKSWIAKFNANGEIQNCGSICGSPTPLEGSPDPVITTPSPTTNTVTPSTGTGNPTLSLENPSYIGVINFSFITIDIPIEVGAPLAPENTRATLTSQNQTFRLRFLLEYPEGGVARNSQSYKLQYALRVGDQCDPEFAEENYQDVNSSSGIAFYLNSLFPSGQSFSESINDPDNNTPISSQTYQESNPFSNSTSAIGGGESGLWDISLRDNTGSAGVYCFRVVRNDGSLLEDYQFIPELVTAPNTGQFLRHGRVFEEGGTALPFYW